MLFHGSVSTEVISALKGVDKKPKAISVPMLQPMNFNSLEKELKGIHTIITIEEHFVEGGLGSIIAERIACERLGYRLIRLGIKNEFIHKIKNNVGMRSHYGISSEKIKGVIEKAYGNG